MVVGEGGSRISSAERQWPAWRAAMRKPLNAECGSCVLRDLRFITGRAANGFTGLGMGVEHEVDANGCEGALPSVSARAVIANRPAAEAATAVRPCQKVA